MKIGVVSLGCPKNLVDSEVMMGLLRKEGFELTEDEEEADIIIVNTCSFIDKAKEESIENILELSRQKESGNCKYLVVTGCLPQRYGEKLLKELPEIDALLGTGDITRITDLINNIEKKNQKTIISAPDFLYDDTHPRLLLTPGNFAYIKITEGCDNCCSYCVIPSIRGRFRSRDPESIMREATNLARRGVREIILIGQDTTNYCKGAKKEYNIARLLGDLAQIKGIRWIRFLYTHPAHFFDELIDIVASEGKICSYIDLPIQHIHDDILQAMERGVTRIQIENLIEKLRTKIPGLVLRTSLIVGFPGEKDRHFETLLEFVEETKFERLGVFTYSKEERTKASLMRNHVPQKIKEERYNAIMQLQAEISLKKNKELIGTDQEVIIDGKSEEKEFIWRGRFYGQVPEIDGVVYIRNGNFKTGDIVNVRINNSNEYDLFSE